MLTGMVAGVDTDDINMPSRKPREMLCASRNFNDRDEGIIGARLTIRD